PEIAPAVAAILRRLMAKDPAARFQTPAEVAVALAPHAVDGPPFWTADKEKELADPPIGPVNSTGDINLDEESALVGTLAANQTLTPLSNLNKHKNQPARPNVRAHPITLLFTLLLAVAILGALVVFVGGWNPLELLK